MIETKAAHVQERLSVIASMLMQHQNNIDLLKGVANGMIQLNRELCADNACRYERTCDDERRLVETLRNLQAQIDLLKYEREVLMHYGA